MRRLWITWWLLVAGSTLLVVGLASGFRGLHNPDGEVCPAVFGSERLVSVLSGRDQECDPTRRAQRTFVEQTLGAGVVALVAGGVLWGTHIVRWRRPTGAVSSWRVTLGRRPSGKHRRDPGMPPGVEFR